MDHMTRKYTTTNFTLRKTGMAVFSALAFVAFANSAKADLVTNGGFESTVCTGAPAPAPACTNGNGGQLPSSSTTGVVTATGWTNTAYSFIFTPGSGDTTGAYSTEFSAPVILWGPN